MQSPDLLQTCALDLKFFCQNFKKLRTDDETKYINNLEIGIAGTFQYFALVQYG